ncbi:MAG: hypoxanthine phosphoribosyltransferase [Bacteroidales bacterium]|jgi:hypoxanthine phosphoribosyltransferase|nr:hypoxanthine phosphoribosyltransferase [Bacteroidales bacterium]
MKENIQIKDKTFQLFITENEINASLDNVAAKMTDDLQDKDPVFVAILNGSFMFASELMKRIRFKSQITFAKIQSYSGLQTTQVHKELIGFSENITGKTVVVVEDIVDSGLTMQYILNSLLTKEPAAIKIATLLLKPDALQYDLKPDYVAFSIPNSFVVGYGLDYDGYGRNLPNIYTLA